MRILNVIEPQLIYTITRNIVLEMFRLLMSYILLPLKITAQMSNHHASEVICPTNVKLSFNNDSLANSNQAPRSPRHSWPSAVAYKTANSQHKWFSPTLACPLTYAALRLELTLVYFLEAQLHIPKLMALIPSISCWLWKISQSPGKFTIYSLFPTKP